jgi:hypothetical protein
VTRGRITCAAALIAIGLSGSAGASPAAQRPERFISFVRGGDRGPTTAWIARADGSHARELGVGDEALLSPNGAYVTVQNYTSKGASLSLYSTAGKLLAAYFTAAKDSASALAWSADSRFLAVSATGTRSVSRSSLYVIDTRTFKCRLITGGVFAGATFNGAGTQLVFGMAKSGTFSAPVNLYSVRAGGGTPSQLTTNGNSFDPLWTRSGIVFDRSTSRGMSKAPIFQLWLDTNGNLKQLTHMKIPDLLDGLSPLAADAEGNRLIAEYTGTDTSSAWTVQLSPLRVRQLTVDGQPVQGGAISSDGTRLLVDAGGFEQSPNHGEVESVGFAGGAPTKLTRGSEPSWSS